MKLVASLAITLFVCGCSCRKAPPLEAGQFAKPEPTASQAEPYAHVGIRMSIVMPDVAIHTVANQEYARWANERHHSGDGSTQFRGVILSDRQMSEIRQILTKHHTVPWQHMLAETPYPRDHTAILLYRTKGEGQMCSIGSPNRAHDILQQIVMSIPSNSRAGLQKSMERMKSTQQDKSSVRDKPRR